MEKVKKLIDAGAPLADAVRVVLGELDPPKSMASLAEETGLSRQNLSTSLTGGRVASQTELLVLANTLGGTLEEWRELQAREIHKRLGKESAAATG